MGLKDWLDQRKRISELEDNLAKVVRLVEIRDMDWVDMKARCKRLLDRTEKAQTRMVQSEDPSSTSGEGANGEAKTATGGVLTTHQREIQQKILKRRAGM